LVNISLIIAHRRSENQAKENIYPRQLRCGCHQPRFLSNLSATKRRHQEHTIFTCSDRHDRHDILFAASFNESVNLQ
jgi:hypothetical protein